MVTEDKVTKVTAAESMAVTVTTEEETTEEEEEVITGAEVTHIAGITTGIRDSTHRLPQR